jgi:hypothetical protein
MKNDEEKLDAHVFDVAVVGGGTAGWMAALSAAREGKSTLLVERKGYVGGVLASGLSIYGFHDVTHRQVVKGYAHEFVQRLEKIGGSDGYTLLDLWHASMVSLDAALVKPLIFEMLHEAGVRTLLYGQIVEVVRKERVIEGIVIQKKTGRLHVRGRMFVDASGDAVLSFLSGLPVDVCEDQPPPTLVLRIENVDIGELRSYLLRHPDQFVNWRMLPGKTVNEEFLRNCKKFLIFPDSLKDFPYVGEYLPLINRVMFTCTPGCTGVTVNMLRAHEVDGTSSESLTRATFDVYRNIVPLVEFFKKRIPGFSRCKLVDCDPEVQLRETRRIIGETTMQVEDVMERKFPSDTISVGGYFIDIHSAKDTGGQWVMVPGAFGIPYGAIVARDADNLLAAGRCISGTKEAAAAYRVMATSMAMGQAAGIAAALSIDMGCSARDLDTGSLRKRLLDTGMVIDKGERK